MKFGTLEKFDQIILAIESQTYEQNKQFEIYKCKVILQDGSNLRILEWYHENQLVYYSYYWLTPLNELLLGWDCAPHHKDIETFPHHKHIGNQKNVSPSFERNLETVLFVIQKALA